MLLPGDLLEELKRLTGVVEVGLFVDIYPEVFFGLEVRSSLSFHRSAR